MNDVELESFKRRIIKETVDLRIDKLLDLRNLIIGARSFDDLTSKLKSEVKWLSETFPELGEGSSEDKKIDMP